MGRPRRVDETHLKIRGRRGYLYQAVGRTGEAVDLMLRADPDVAADRMLFRPIDKVSCLE
ncbi:DDE-type integrase/transposase/recombinase [Burkholderia sp. LMG 32019]|uniref:DDE-type integrase/transposase/recombinase n=1 Tax=Burkholderia sp. LMG 32019 TaxID=3158173 RepID=UPI003C2E5A38